MRAIDKMEAEERKQSRYNRQKGKCAICGKRVHYSEAQLAHRIPKGYAKVYGEAIIHHELNTPLTCSACNDSVLLNPGARPVEAEELIEKIKKVTDLQK